MPEAHSLLKWQITKGTFKMLRRIVLKLRSVREARRNRVWVVFIDENRLLLLSPDYFKKYCPGEDQLSKRDLANTALRLGSCLRLEAGLELTYLKKFKLKGGTEYKDLHVFYVVVPQDMSIPEKMKGPWLQSLSDAPQQREVKEALKKVLENDPRHVLLQLQVNGII